MAQPALRRRRAAAAPPAPPPLPARSHQPAHHPLTDRCAIAPRQGRKKQDTSFPGLSRADVNEFIKIVSPGIDILGVDLSGNFLGDETVQRMLEAIGNCP